MAVTRCSSKDFPYLQRKVLQTLVSSRLRVDLLIHFVERQLITAEEVFILASLDYGCHKSECLGFKWGDFQGIVLRYRGNQVSGDHGTRSLGFLATDFI